MSKLNALRRTHQKVWADSLTRGEFESEVYRPPAREEMALALDAAERFEKRNKAKGERNGPIGYVGLDVYRALWRRVNFRTGQCDPTIGRLCEDSGHCRRAVVEALKRLWNLGLVRWIRRLVYTGQRGVRGPQVQQTSNAYELRILPRAFLDGLPRGKRERYRPRILPVKRPADRGERHAQARKTARVARAWARMGDKIRTGLLASLDRKLARRAARAAAAFAPTAEREYSQGAQTMPAQTV